MKCVLFFSFSANKCLCKSAAYTLQHDNDYVKVRMVKSFLGSKIFNQFKFIYFTYYMKTRPKIQIYVKISENKNENRC